MSDEKQDNKVERHKVVLIVAAAVVITYLLTPKTINNFYVQPISERMQAIVRLPM